jgi:hypothetical protein
MSHAVQSRSVSRRSDDLHFSLQIQASMEATIAYRRINEVGKADLPRETQPEELRNSRALSIFATDFSTAISLVTDLDSALNEQRSGFGSQANARSH